jgi:Uma2 family endonuclease
MDARYSDAFAGTRFGPRLTLAEFELLPDTEERRELVRGRLVREPPAGYEHGRLGSRLLLRVARHVEERALGETLGSETGFILFEDPPTVRAPDVAFVSAGRVPDAGSRAGFARLAPDLAVEVVSPSNRLSEIQDKALDYLAAGSRLVWVLEPEGKRVVVYRTREDIRILMEGDVLDGEDVLPGFSVPVAELFAR